MLRTTPESAHEVLPLVNKNSATVIAADARIDNRAELLAALGLDALPHEMVADSQLILAAYEHWGERCPARLLGDFAFAIWDARRQVLFCARDHFGVKPFYFHHAPGRLFCFGSEMKALLCLSEVPHRLNEAKVADFLEMTFDDVQETLIDGIVRLPPGHTLVAGRAGVRTACYWSLDPSRELHLDTDQGYADAFRAIFTEAVRCRLRSAHPVGALLSGGLDSSSIACVARQLLSDTAHANDGALRTFSAVFDDVPECDERTYQEAVIALGGITPYTLRADRLSPLGDVERALWHQDEPLYGPGLYLTRALAAAAHEHGVRVVLDGHGGDEVVSHGYGYLEELTLAGRWIALARELRGVARIDGHSFVRLLGRYVGSGLRARLRRSRYARPIQRMRDRLWSDRLWPRQAGRPTTGRPCARGQRQVPLVNPTFAARVAPMRGRGKARLAVDPTVRRERARHYRDVTSGLQTYALEVLDRANAANHVEPRYPFWDKRLVEFCLALPPEQKLRHGWSRMVMRRALAGVLPLEVRWRVDKTNFLPALSRGLLRFEHDRLEDLIACETPGLGSYVDVAALRDAVATLHRLGTRTPSRDVFVIWQTVALALWMQSRPTEPCAAPNPELSFAGLR
jgi:asparagine synthase (glutamine-hydrolysing)